MQPADGAGNESQIPPKFVDGRVFTDGFFAHRRGTLEIRQRLLALFEAGVMHDAQAV